MTTPKRAVIIDDEESLRLLLSEMLAELGFRVDMCVDLGGFSDALMEPTSLVISDWRMHRIGIHEGAQLPVMVRAKKRFGSVIAVCSGTPDDLKRFQDQTLIDQLDRVVKKPFHVAEIFALTQLCR